MDNFTIGRTVSRKSSPDAMRICLGDFPGQVSALFVGCAHHRSWCFQRTRLCTWERRLSYFLTIASCPPYIRGALVYSLVHRGYAAESTRISACIYKSRICWSWSWQTSKICLERGIVEGADRLCFGMRKSMSFNAFDE